MGSGMELTDRQDILGITQQFLLQGEIQSVKPFGNGHINDTFRIVTQQDGIQRRYVLQRINGAVFKRPLEVMENIVAVTSYLQSPQMASTMARVGQQALELVAARNGGYCFEDDCGHVWRVYVFVHNAYSIDIPDTPEKFLSGARAFGDFFTLLADFPANRLHETIPDFHNTPVRYRQLMEAVERDPLGRAAQVQPELEFVAQRAGELDALTSALAAGELPMRVTHNDTKLNNVLFDNDTGKGVCVIDLDTVMPGLAAYDFGDAIRSGANTGAEDEPDLSKCGLSMPMYRAYAKGFLERAGADLTPGEIRSLPMGAKLMTLECGMRFLTDHILGDVYFKVARANHNLDRARTQLHLAEDMERHWQQMNAVTLELSGV